MNEEDKKIQKHLVGEMMKVSKTNPDVMLYMQTLMEKYEQIEKENQKLNKIIDELEKFLKEGCDLTCGSGITNEYIYAYENALDKLLELKKEVK